MNFFNNLSLNDDSTLAGIFVLVALIGIFIVWMLNRPLKVAVPHASGEHAHAHETKRPWQVVFAEHLYNLAIWIFATYMVSVTWAMLGHCGSDTTCSVFDLFWMRLVEVSMRYTLCPASWILITLLVFKKPINNWLHKYTGFRSVGWLFSAIWIFTVMPYVYGGYNTDPWDEVWRLSGHNPPALLQFLFPVTFG